MADEPNDSNSPLLGHAQEDELWDQVEEAPPVEEITIQQLISERPEGVLEFLQDKGVRKLGEFVMQDRVVLGKLGDDSIATMGATKPVGDFEAAWRREMGAPKKDDKTGWTTCIPVLAYVVTIKDAAKPDKEGLLQPLLRRWQAGGCSYAAFSLPAVQAVIDWKWSRFCRKLLLWELAFFFLWLAAFSIFTIAFQDEDTSLSLRELLATSRGRLTVAMDFLALLGMAPFLLIEAATIAAYGWGWVQVWNILDTCTYVNQIAIVVMHLGRLNISSNWLSIAAAVQIILLLFRVQYFSRVFRPTRFAFVDSLKEVLHDVKYYLLFLVIIMFGFAAAFHILFREDQKKHDEFSTIGKSFITMVNWAAGNADINTMYKHSHNPVAASALAVVFVFVLAVVLMNLLIGILTNSLQRVTDNEGLRMLLSKAQVIDEIESTIPAWVERMFPQLYPPYLHVLRVDPDKLDSVKLDNLWSKEGEDEGPPILQENRSADSGHREQGGSTQLNGSGEGGSSREDALEQKLDAVMKELQELKSLLRPAGALHSEQ